MLRLWPLLFFSALFFLALYSFSQTVSAQTDDLSTTIRAAILSDPRSQNMPEAELEAMVQVLAQEAQAQGVTSEDIVWRPQENETFSASEGIDVASSGISNTMLFSLLGIIAALAAFFLGRKLFHRSSPDVQQAV